MSTLLENLAPYGVISEQIRLFQGREDPALLPYSTLTGPTAGRDEALLALQGVYEWQASPLIYLVDGARLDGEDHLRVLRRLVALRGDADYLGVVEPGCLTIHAVGLDKTRRSSFEIKRIRSTEPDARVTFSSLAMGALQPPSPSRPLVTATLLAVIDECASGLQEHGISPLDALSLTGRAVFTRFLADRRLLPPNLAAGHADLFSTPTRSRATSEWLDQTFNGDFLPLKDLRWGSMPRATCRHLSNVMHRAPGGQLHLGWDSGWAHLDFAHVPVGVLSRAYESFVHKRQQARGRREGVYYTPAVLAERMVRESFCALRTEGCAHRARVLDPSVGAGVFLLATFRQLVAEHWLASGCRPDTIALRRILQDQLRGFDINEEALRFAALGLYLMAIELDANPEPVEKLQFSALRGTVLHYVGDNHHRQCAGSLGPRVGDEHAATYDLVIGNPPWTGSTRYPAQPWQEVEATVAAVAVERGLSTPPRLPNRVQDLPFVWRAMEWARPEGQIALALHGRLLFQQGDGMPEARAALFNTLDVTGVVNGAELRETDVWPGVRAPFCLLFARNRLPRPTSAFRFVSPRLEGALTAGGRLRIDSANAHQITHDELVQEPRLFKILFRGTELDREVLARMKQEALPTLEAYWASLFGWKQKGRLRQSGNGYQCLRRSSRKKKGALLAGDDARNFLGWPELSTKHPNRLLLDAESLDRFDQERVHRLRDPSIYEGPLLLVREAPRVGRGRLGVSVVLDRAIFNQSFFGYCANGHPQAQLLVRYLALLLSSHVSLWYALITSGRFGVEREAVEKAIIDQTPVRPLESLQPDLHGRIVPLFEAVARQPSEENWADVDHWAAEVYGLGEDDLSTIEGTLSMELPFAKSLAAAQRIVAHIDVGGFLDGLDESLRPWVEREGASLDLSFATTPQDTPWLALRVRALAAQDSTVGLVQEQAGTEGWWDAIHVADSLGATELFHPVPETRTLWVARLRFARHWTRNAARLCARRIIWRHLDSLLGEGDP